jgi:hypothetical protein
LRRAVTNLMTCLLAEQDLCVPNYICDYVAAGSLMTRRTIP